jgi:hypothetical protein
VEGSSAVPPAGMPSGSGGFSPGTVSETMPEKKGKRWVRMVKFFCIVSRFTRNTPVITIKKISQKSTASGSALEFFDLPDRLPLFFRSATLP